MKGKTCLNPFVTILFILCASGDLRTEKKCVHIRWFCPKTLLIPRYVHLVDSMIGKYMLVSRNWYESDGMTQYYPKSRSYSLAVGTSLKLQVPLRPILSIYIAFLFTGSSDGTTTSDGITVSTKIIYIGYVDCLARAPVIRTVVYLVILSVSINSN